MERAKRDIHAHVDTTEEIEPGLTADDDAQPRLVGIEVPSVSQSSLPESLRKAA